MPLEQWLPAVNTSLIVASGFALILGRVAVAKGRIPLHKRAMLTATGFAALFLVTYVVRWALLGSKSFDGTGPVRLAYFALLAGHILLATAIAPMAFVTLRRALSGRIEAHKRIAPWTFTAWVIAAASGWGVYWMLYHWPE